MRHGLLLLLAAVTTAAGQPLAAGPTKALVAIVYTLTGEAFQSGPAQPRHAIGLFDCLSAGAVLEVAPGARLSLAFASGKRWLLGGGARVTLGAKDLKSRIGDVRALPDVPTLPPLAPIREDDHAGTLAGAVRIRGERIKGLYPGRGATAVADATVLRFQPVEGTERYRIEVQDGKGKVLFAADTDKAETSLPADRLRPGASYHWSVRTVGRALGEARGEAGFTTLDRETARRREQLWRVAEGQRELTALLAGLDRQIGLLAEARDELREEVAATPEDAALRAALAEVEKNLSEYTEETDQGETGVVIEEVAPGSATERAGLQMGDELAAWSGELGSTGVLRTPFDFDSVKIEQAPRGIVILQGFREGEARTWHVPSGDWGIEARLSLAPELLALYEQGRQRITAGDLDAGAALWRSVLDALERQGVPEHISWLENRLAKAFAAAGRWPEADAAWEQAERRLEVPSPSGAAQILYEWGRSLDQRTVYDRAEPIFRRALHLEPEGSLAAARELNALGTVARQRNALVAAESLLHQGYSIRERLAPESLDLASSLNELGVVAALRGEIAVAEESFSRVLNLQQRLAPNGVGVAGTLINLGNVTKIRGDFMTAEERFRHAVDLLESQRPANQELARALSCLGDVEMDRGELAIAEEHFRRALVIRQELAPESLGVAGSVQNLGIVAVLRGDFAAAEEHHRRALEIREKLAPGSVEVAESLSNLGATERRRGELVKADELYQRALAIQEKTAPESLAATEMRNERALVALERRDLALAEELYGRVLSDQAKSPPESLQVGDGLKGLGVVAYERGDLPKAEDLLRRALVIYEKLVPGSTRLGTLLNDLGQVYRRAGRSALAAEYLCHATEVFDQQRKKLGGTTEGRSAFGGTTAGHYRDCLAALVEIGRPEEAFQAMERGRARSFLDLLAERDLRWTADLPPELARARKLADADYDRTQATLARLSPARAEPEMHRLQVRLRELRAQQEEIIEKVRQASPRNATLHYPQPLDLTAARKILDPGTLLVAYSIGRDRSFLFVVGPAENAGPGLEVFPLSLGDQALRQRVESFRNLSQRADSDPVVLARQGRELYDLLLRPADSRIAKAARLLISPDGPLHTLPFAALVRDGRFLAEQKPIHTVISITVYAELKKSRSEGPLSRQMDIAAFGDPSYPPLPSGQSSALHPEVRAALGRGLDLTPLPSTRDEVQGITSLYPGARAFLGTEATEERAKSIGVGTRYLHFACHALLDEQFPLSFALALSIPDHPREGQDNGLLQAWEIFEGMRLDADLVTLSACDSAMGSEMGGEGLLGLTRAFQYAGARSVLASLWSVSDASTADLMKRFYGYLRQGKAKDEALRAAQTDLIHSPELSHPYHWAAFQLSGDWQ